MWFALLHAAWAFPPIPQSEEIEGIAARMGRVEETFDSGGFTYVRLATDEGEIWVAGPPTRLSPGDIAATTEGVLIANFHSRTLDRTFSRIWFVAGMRLMGPAPSAPAPVLAPPLPTGALNIALIQSKRAELAGTEVTFSGQVTRLSEAILGRNWLHLQDGSCAGCEIVVTSASKAAVGQGVVVRGRLATDRDFGAGYRYALIVEDAQIEVQP